MRMTLAAGIALLANSRRAEILEHMLQHRRRHFTVNELARSAGIPVATTWHAVRALADAGLAISDRFGNSSIVRLNEASPALRAFATLRIPNPHMMAFEEFAGLVRRRSKGVEVRLFGSVSKGTQRPESDVDVEVVYGKSGLAKETVADICAKASAAVWQSYRIVVSAVVSKVPMVSL